MFGTSNAFKRASEVLERHRERLQEMTGVHGVAVRTAVDHGGDEGVCLVIYVDSTVDRRSLPSEIEGIPVYTIP